MSKKEYDVVVVGGSMPGYLTALRAAELGLETAIVEENRIGGIQMLAAEMPLQTLLSNDKILQECMKAAQKGLSFSGAAFDPDSFYKSIETGANAFSKKLVDDLKKSNVDVFLGNSTIGKDHTITIEREGTKPREFSWKKLIYADEPVTKIPEVVDEKVHGYYTLENFGLLDTLPNGLIIYGSGEKACQAALVWSGLGSQVYLISPQKRLLSEVPEEITKRYEEELKRRKVTIYTDSDIKDIFQDSAGVFHVDVENMKDHEVVTITGSELMILSDKEASFTGIKDLGLEVKDGWIVTDDTLKTSLDDVYTWTGSKDSIGNSALIPEAAEYLAQVVAGERPGSFNKESDTVLINLNPVYASVGTIDKEELEDEEVIIGRTSGDEYVEIVIDPEFGEILGAQAFGNDAEDIISTVAMLINSEGSAYDLEEIVLPDNSALATLQEAVKNARKSNIN